MGISFELESITTPLTMLEDLAREGLDADWRMADLPAGVGVDTVLLFVTGIAPVLTATVGLGTLAEMAHCAELVLATSNICETSDLPHVDAPLELISREKRQAFFDKSIRRAGEVETMEAVRRFRRWCLIGILHDAQVFMW